jgi:DeoR/GlpR family transcriptional regulator of sugar metabolism
VTRRVRVRRGELTEEFQCTELTITRIFNHLAQAGYIRKCDVAKQYGVEIEVLCPPSSKTESI